jgi:hypothetical protein
MLCLVCFVLSALSCLCVGLVPACFRRNSEVVHAGLYYPEGSKKAKHCVQGRAMLYEYCTSRNINHMRCGKLIVATDSSQVGFLLLSCRVVSSLLFCSLVIASFVLLFGICFFLSCPVLVLLLFFVFCFLSFFFCLVLLFLGFLFLLAVSDRYRH